MMSPHDRGFARGHSRRTLRFCLLAGVAFVAAPVLAQEAPAQSEATQVPQDFGGASAQDIIVTGLRETLQTSINEKRRETAIVDSLSSTEIGDLPALSVGEAIQTITGATTHREKGGASEISLRGLGSFLSNTTINGRDASNGSGDRAVNFNQFPSELINGIKIYKTQQADLVEGGVAGTIELGTIRPLAFKKRRIQLDFKTNYSPYQDRIRGSSAWGWRGTASYVDQFDAGALGEIGIALGVQRNKTNNPEETYAASSTWVACNPGIAVPNGNCSEVSREQAAAGTPFALVPNAATYRQISENDKRDAIFGAIQWRPSSTLDINLDVQYSKRNYAENRRDLNLSEMRYGLSNIAYDENGVITHLEGRTSLEAVGTLLERDEEYRGGGFNVEWRPADRLTIKADASYSRTVRTDVERSVRLRTDPLDIYGNPTVINNQRVGYIYDVAPGSYAPTLTIDPRFDVNDYALFSDDARLRRDELQRRNRIIAGRLDATYEMDGFLRSVAAGARWTEQTYSDYDDRVEITQDSRAVDRDVNLACRTTFPQSDYLSNAPGNQLSSWATFDPVCQFREYLGTEDPGRNADVRSVANRDVTERTLAAYLMANYESTLGDMPIRGNFGVRAVQTRVTSNGLRSDLQVVNNPDGSIRLVDSGVFDTVTIKSKSTRLLPSINAIFELKPDLLLRLAGYRAMSRPAPSALGAGRTIQLEDGTNFSSVADAISLITANGSPRLKPLMSWNADASLEYYLNKDSLFSATVYYKQFTGGFIPVVLNEDYSIGGQNYSIPVVQTQNSTRKSRVYGLEVTLANRFTWLPAPFDGLGGKVSYNYANSNFRNEDIRLGAVYDPETGETTPGMIPAANLSGYSKHVVSGQLYYSLGKLNLSAIYNYRSKYYQDFVGGNSQLRYVRGNQTLDLRASYDVTPNVQLQFQAVNVFDEPKITDMPVQGSIRQYHYYGSRYFLGVRAKI
ncbi:putative TonB dependent receptor protein [Sphingomonas sp. LH128]|uniref:TonB-dependent receptor n=1 Tax=Sphingomonas sp. LH128 TaxID=473781 RepID=UPI00027C9C1F|nr:TonB-dependent receptor [Sphingomonas sp. LH128]EJU11011.1 putative TonB dependent receptor protein [Sphingomonas sp. LH128]